MRKCQQCAKKFKPKFENQKDCSELCLANRFDTLVKKTRTTASNYAKTMGYKSMTEVRFAARLKSANIKFEYERDTFVYQHDPQEYTPDFFIDDSSIVLEVKGKLDYQTRRKLISIKKSNPDLDIRLVFEKPNNRISRGAKTRYWNWAEREGFPWYSDQDIDKLQNHLREERLARKKSKTTTKSKRAQPKGLAKTTPK